MRGTDLRAELVRQQMLSVLIRQWVATLAHNLAVAGALCEAFDMGWNQAFGDGSGEDYWRPGCGRGAV